MKRLIATLALLIAVGLLAQPVQAGKKKGKTGSAPATKDDVAAVLAELQAMRAEMKKGFDDVKKEQEKLREEVGVLVKRVGDIEVRLYGLEKSVQKQNIDFAEMLTEQRRLKEEVRELSARPTSRTVVVVDQPVVYYRFNDEYFRYSTKEGWSAWQNTKWYPPNGYSYRYSYSWVQVG